MRKNIQELKNAINEIATTQKVLKQNRKTVNFIGERSIPAYEAAYKVQSNKYELRHMYLAYGILRGKDLKTIDSGVGKPFDVNKPLLLDYANKIAEKYPFEEEPVSEGFISSIKKLVA